MPIPGHEPPRTGKSAAKAAEPVSIALNKAPSEVAARRLLSVGRNMHTKGSASDDVLRGLAVSQKCLNRRGAISSELRPLPDFNGAVVALSKRKFLPIRVRPMPRPNSAIVSISKM
jgi:hypothetical protein